MASPGFEALRLGTVELGAWQRPCIKLSNEAMHVLGHYILYHQCVIQFLSSRPQGEEGATAVTLATLRLVDLYAHERQARCAESTCNAGGKSVQVDASCSVQDAGKRCTLLLGQDARQCCARHARQLWMEERGCSRAAARQCEVEGSSHR